MTKTHYILSALAGLLLAGGCQREGLECVGGAETVSYTVQVPECLAVKAGPGDGFTVYYEVYRDGDLDEAGVAPMHSPERTTSMTVRLRQAATSPSCVRWLSSASQRPVHQPQHRHKRCQQRRRTHIRPGAASGGTLTDNRNKL